jgi:hypothetical protein
MNIHTRKNGKKYHVVTKEEVEDLKRRTEECVREVNKVYEKYRVYHWDLDDDTGAAPYSDIQDEAGRSLSYITEEQATALEQHDAFREITNMGYGDYDHFLGWLYSELDLEGPKKE